MKNARTILLFLLIISIPIAEAAKKRTFKCTLMSTWMNVESGYGGGCWEEGNFSATVGLSSDEPTIVKTFNVGDDRVVTTSLRAIYFDGKPLLLSISINAAKADTDTTSTEYKANEVSAEVSFASNWKQLSVEKKVRKGEMVYTYWFICEKT